MRKQKAVGNESSSSAGCSAEHPVLLYEDVQCPICLNLLVEPVRMPCSHCLCRTCFTTNLKKSTLQCPVCRARLLSQTPGRAPHTFVGLSPPSKKKGTIVRIGTFARRSMKTDTLVDEVLWKAIQKQFKQKLKLQKKETVSSNQVVSPVVGSPAAPGEIRKEFEQQMREHQQAHQLAELEKQMSLDEQLAARLQAELNTPAVVTRRHSMAASVTVESVNTSNDSEGDDDDDENPSESRKLSARRLFMNLSNKSSSAKSKPDGSLSSANRKRKAASIQGDAAKENSAPQKRSRSGSKKRQQFAGCVKRPRLAGTAVLDITVDTTDDDEAEVSYKSNDASSLNTSNDKLFTTKSLTFKNESTSETSVIIKANKETSKISRQKSRKSGSTASGSNNKQCSPTTSPPVAKAAKRASVRCTSNISGDEPSPATTSDCSVVIAVAGSSRASLSNGGSSRTSSGYGSGSYSVSPHQRRRMKLGLDELQDVAIALMQEGPHDLESTRSGVRRQRA